MGYTLNDAQTLIHDANWKDTPQLEYAVLAWLNAESGGLSSSNNAGTNNPLNMKYTPGYGSNSAGFSIFPNWGVGLQQTALRIQQSSYYTQIDAAGRAGNAQAFLNAVAISPWDSGFITVNGQRIPHGGYGLTYDPNTGGYTGTNRLIGIYNSLIGSGSGVNAISTSYQTQTSNLSSGVSTFLTAYIGKTFAQALSDLTQNAPNQTAIADSITQALQALGISPSTTITANNVSQVAAWTAQNKNGLIPDIPGAIASVGNQITDTFIWIGFIFLGLTLLIGGIFLLKPEATKDIATSALRL